MRYKEINNTSVEPHSINHSRQANSGPKYIIRSTRNLDQVKTFNLITSKLLIYCLSGNIKFIQALNHFNKRKFILKNIDILHFNSIKINIEFLFDMTARILAKEL